MRSVVHSELEGGNLVRHEARVDRLALAAFLYTLSEQVTYRGSEFPCLEPVKESFQVVQLEGAPHRNSLGRVSCPK